MTRRGERGAVTAELALALPLLLALTVCLVWLISLGAAQVRVVDASREAARVVARGDDPARASALARRVAPPGADVRISRTGGDVVVETSARVAPPLGVLGDLGAVTLRSRAVAAAEEDR